MITFATTMFNEAIVPHTRVWLQSLLDTYGKKARVVLYYGNLHQKFVDEFKRGAPHYEFRRLRMSRLPTERKHGINVKVYCWQQVLDEMEVKTKLVLMDADTLVAQPIEEVFNHQFDVGYTYRDNGERYLLNTGVMFFRVSEHARKWAADWIKLTNEALNTRGRVRLWGGGDQAALGKMLGGDEMYKIEDRGVLQASALKADGNIYRGFPCAVYNQVNCAPLSLAKLIHYKGGWLDVLSGKGWSDWRPKVKCEPMYNLWMETKRRWMERR